MERRKSGDSIIGLVQALVWVALCTFPALINWIVVGTLKDALGVLKITVLTLLPVMILYALNYYLLIPKLLYPGGKRKRWFYLANALLILLMDLRMFFPSTDIPQEVLDNFGVNRTWAFIAIACMTAIIVQVIFILLALGVRNIRRNRELQVAFEQQKRQSAEAELVWLKHQLNPHFLFNTLNNISSLTQIDPDEAQERIGQLSDLLRYALYDSEAEKVPLAAEMQFMENYIDLMSLRCGDRTTVGKDFAVPAEPAEIAPLLFIPLVENAFKHGVNARFPSFVRIAMRLETPDQVGHDDVISSEVEKSHSARKVVFRCENSLFEKQGTDHIGSGIGLENMRRRLELLYPGKYTYAQSASEGCWRVEVTIEV